MSAINSASNALPQNFLQICKAPVSYCLLPVLKISGCVREALAKLLDMKRHFVVS